MLKPRTELLQRSFLNPRNVRPRDTELFRDFLLRHRSTNRAVDIGNAITFADYLSLALVKLFDNISVQPLRINFQLGNLLNIDVARYYVLNRESIPLGVAFDRLADVKFGLLVLHFAEVHFYLISNNTLEETSIQILNAA